MVVKRLRAAAFSMCLGVSALPGGMAHAQELSPAEREKSFRDFEVSICKDIVRMSKERGRPIPPECGNVLETNRAEGSPKARKALCFPKGSKVDMCDMARDTAALMSRDLPRRVDSQSSLTAATARGRALRLVYTYNVRGSQARGFYTSMFQSKPESPAAMDAHIRKRLCANPGTAVLVTMGMTVEVLYMSEDRSILASSVVTRCV